MKVIIAGGRNYVITPEDMKKLDCVNISQVVSGGATGADYYGEQYASSRGLPCKVFRADWRNQGKAAGPIRNKEMALYADAVVLFPGGRGTESMRKEARNGGLDIFDFTLKYQ